MLLTGTTHCKTSRLEDVSTANHLNHPNHLNDLVQFKASGTKIFSSPRSTSRATFLPASLAS
ncbi:hypothetical protein ABTJ37_20730, partial [Acinetobacter baumannii]